MRQKAVALLIVLMIGVVTTVVLYSPAKVRGPQTTGAAIGVPKPLLVAPRAEAAQEITREPVKLARRPFPSAKIRSTMAGLMQPPQPHGEPLSDVPAFAAAVPLVSAAPLVPAPLGRVPHLSPPVREARGAMQVVGQSIGAAFATTGRSVGTAFKRVF